MDPLAIPVKGEVTKHDGCFSTDDGYITINLFIQIPTRNIPVTRVCVLTTVRHPHTQIGDCTVRDCKLQAELTWRHATMFLSGLCRCRRRHTDSPPPPSTGTQAINHYRDTHYISVAVVKNQSVASEYISE